MQSIQQQLGFVNRKLDQEANQNVLGQYSPQREAASIITLFDGAYASTIIHETGHYFIDAMATTVQDTIDAEASDALFDEVGNVDINGIVRAATAGTNTDFEKKKKGEADGKDKVPGQKTKKRFYAH